MLKSSSKQRPSFLPDSAVQSPLAELSASNVTLKSLRPKGSMVNMNYSLPLRANFGMISKYIRERIVTEY